MIANASVYSPTDLDGALALLAEHGDALTIVAGGTDLMVHGNPAMATADPVLNIWELNELRGIEEDGDWVVIGALTSYTEIIHSMLVQQSLPALVASAKTVGAVQIQNRGTLGGNLGNASPAADTPPVLLAAEAEVDLVSQQGTRRVALDEFFLGYRSIDRRPDEIVARVRCRKKADNDHDWYRKVGPRLAQAISKVVLGGRLRVAGNGEVTAARLAAGSVAATTVRLRKTEAALCGQILSAALADEAGRVAADEVAPIDDIRSTADYRSTVTHNLVRRWILDVMAQSR